MATWVASRSPDGHGETDMSVSHSPHGARVNGNSKAECSGCRERCPTWWRRSSSYGGATIGGEEQEKVRVREWSCVALDPDWPLVSAICPPSRLSATNRDCD